MDTRLVAGWRAVALATAIIFLASLSEGLGLGQHHRQGRGEEPGVGRRDRRASSSTVLTWREYVSDKAKLA